MKAERLNLLAQIWLYFRTGYGLYLVFPIGLLTNASMLYYSLVVNNAWLLGVFPAFEGFLGWGIVGVFISCTTAGVIHYLILYRFEQRVYADSSGYMVDAAALYAATIEIAEKVGASDAPAIMELRKLKEGIKK